MSDMAVREIPLTQGKVAIVDESDYSVVSQHKWYADGPFGTYGTYYAVTKVKRHTKVYLHRLILGAHPHWNVDHINCDGLDNRRCNLRPCSQSENIQNARKHRDSLSAYKGVSRDWESRRWRAVIKKNGRSFHLGRFVKEEEAARAYDEAALRLFGEFARLNFPAEATP